MHGENESYFNQFPIEEVKELIILNVYSLLGIKVPNHFIS